ncbi:MAG: DUF1566 domain-containing protein, partial [Spirochaetales bacterium]|nr:DUF1566 domain-containing protein [Spirochaetales bacterium]
NCGEVTYNDSNSNEYKRPNIKNIIYPSGLVISAQLNTDLENISNGRVMYFGDTSSNLYNKLSNDFYLKDLLYDYYYDDTKNKYNSGKYFAIEPYAVELIQKIYDSMAWGYKNQYPVAYTDLHTGLISETYRDPYYNESIGSKSTDSHHITGTAIDFRVSGFEMYSHIIGIIESIPEIYFHPDKFWIEPYDMFNPHFHIQFGKYLDYFKDRKFFDYDYSSTWDNTTFTVTTMSIDEENVKNPTHFVIYNPCSVLENRDVNTIFVEGKINTIGLDVYINNVKVEIDENGLFTTNTEIDENNTEIIGIGLLNNVEVQRIVRDMEPAPTYTVVYDDNNSTRGNVPVDETLYREGSTVYIWGNTGNLAGTEIQDGIKQVFLGWNTNPIATKAEYFGGNSFVIKENTTLYAIYSSDSDLLRKMGPAGGLVFYDKGYYSLDWRYMEAAPMDQSTGALWGCSGTSISGADGLLVGTGEQNTIDIKFGCGTIGIAADICTNLIIEGYDDWFLPSRDEWNLMFVNLYQYGMGNFNGSHYWSSSEYDDYYNGAYNAWLQNFTLGQQNGAGKTYEMRVRAVRSF